MLSALPTSPSVARNRTAILEVLRELLGDARAVLEIASGTGAHSRLARPRTCRR